MDGSHSLINYHFLLEKFNMPSEDKIKYSPSQDSPIIKRSKGFGTCSSTGKELDMNHRGNLSPT